MKNNESHSNISQSTNSHTNLCQKNGIHKKLSLLVFDFDETLTDVDTTQFLPFFIAHSIPNKRKEIFRTWETLTESYFENYKSILKRHASDDTNRKCLETLMESLEQVEIDSIKQVEDSKVLKGIPKDTIKFCLNDFLLKKFSPNDEHLVSFLRKVLRKERKFETHVLSINFSQVVLESVIGTFFEGERTDKLFDSIQCNDLELDESGLTTGKLVNRVIGARGKERIFENLQSCNKGGMTVFVGDSVSDLLAMLKADVGVIIGKNCTLRDVAKIYRIEIIPLNTFYETERKRNRLSEEELILYEAESWKELDELIFGTDI